MYDQIEYPLTACACGEHFCQDCARNETGDPTDCQEFECYAGAICRFKQR